VCALAIGGFGAAPSYGTAVLMRCLPGLLNGITGALKTIIGESFDGDGQARALSALSCAWGIGETAVLSYSLVSCKQRGEMGAKWRCQCSILAGPLQAPLLAACLEAPSRTLAESWGPACLSAGLGSSSTGSRSSCRVQQLERFPALQQSSGNRVPGC
jgi:hypothetical protein